ncbi:bacteriophage CI repressor [Shewanella sp. W3-18-1]|uniref:helix-turn-helix transcriptional regulator n=1 Tax=Shewanella sp. (strain W3-18-1) TaxID=351745 RepID=UPI0000ECFB41|nr:helix-turn-helix transcriptional regulator [Shewanella sp. W3-18-1]ABM25728.1 bacteriophage CI repressor [Shewanella sp. W3-18-1]
MTYAQAKNTEFRIKLDQVPIYDGGKDIVERLIKLFGVKNRLELADLLGMHPGSFSTWQTRNTTPHELLIRIHLATGISMNYLCFGISNGEQDPYKYGASKTVEFLDGKVVEESVDGKMHARLKIVTIDDGKISSLDHFFANTEFLNALGLDGDNDDLVVKSDGHLLFINSSKKNVNSGRYLYSIGDVYQIGTFKLLPDGITYLFDDNAKYPINADVTKIHGKVVSVLETV